MVEENVSDIFADQFGVNVKTLCAGIGSELKVGTVAPPRPHQP